VIKSRIRWVGHGEHVGRKRNACRIFVRKPEGKRPLRRRRRWWENNIKCIFKNIVGERRPYSPGSGQGQVVGCYPMGWTVQGSNSGRYKRFALPQNLLHRFWDTHSLLFTGYWE